MEQEHQSASRFILCQQIANVPRRLIDCSFQPRCDLYLNQSKHFFITNLNIRSAEHSVVNLCIDMVPADLGRIESRKD